jgi:hypothetical protein
MASGIDWLRWHHGTVSDLKFPLVARRAGGTVAEVIAVWACLLEEASMAAERGNPGIPDFETLDCALGLPDGRAMAIYRAMIDRSLIDEGSGRLVAWERRQPKRERDDGSSTDRVRAHRERQHQAAETVKRQETPGNAKDNQGTPGNDTERQETPREENIRREIKESPPNPPLRGGDSPDDESGESDAKRERRPRTSLKTFIDACTQAGEKPISEYRPLLEYVDATGLPMEFVQLAWEVFKGEFLPPNGAKSRRLQADWRRHFLNYVTKGYYRLWYARTAEGGATEYVLTTQGVQAQAAVSARGRRDGQA